MSERLQLRGPQALAVAVVLRSLQIAESACSDFALAASAPTGSDCWWYFAAFPQAADGQPRRFQLSPRLELSQKTPAALDAGQELAVSSARLRLARLAREFGLSPIVIQTPRRGRPSQLAGRLELRA